MYDLEETGFESAEDGWNIDAISFTTLNLGFKLKCFFMLLVIYMVSIDSCVQETVNNHKQSCVVMWWWFCCCLASTRNWLYQMHQKRA